MRHTEKIDDGLNQMSVTASEHPFGSGRNGLDDLRGDRLDFRPVCRTEPGELLAKSLQLGTPDLLEAYLQSPSRSLSAHLFLT